MYDRIGKYAGAGSIVPITGFANSVAAPAMEFRREGLVLGLGAKLFHAGRPGADLRHQRVHRRGRDLLDSEGVAAVSRRGAQTFVYDRPPAVAAHASIVGPKEGQGPLADWFDVILPDDLLGRKSWEQAESEMVRQAAVRAMNDAGLSQEAAQAMLGGDLNNQIISSSFAARTLGIPFLGLYGACSTFAESLLLASALLSGGYLDNALCAASSHFCTAERQFRSPVELGNQKPPQASRTATACGCAALTANASPNQLRVLSGTVGRVIDLQIKDANHMGAAMAPAVCACIEAHLSDLGRTPRDYDLIATGDLGWIGRNILMELFHHDGVDMPDGNAGGLRRKPVLSGAGRARRRKRLRLRGGGELRMADEAHGARRAEAGAPRGLGGHVQPHQHPAGRDHSRHRLRRLSGRRRKVIHWLIYVKAFAVGGLICVVGQLLLQYTKLTSSRILVLFVVSGVVLTGLGVYKPLVDFAGAGATVPLTGFGYSLAMGAIEAVNKYGLIGALAGGVTRAAAGISAAILFGLLNALIFKPHAKP